MMNNCELASVTVGDILSSLLMDLTDKMYQPKSWCLWRQWYLWLCRKINNPSKKIGSIFKLRKV